MMRRRPARRGQRGQAMAEMVLMAGVTSMLFLGIWYLGKYHDIQASTIQAARYVAWERTVHAPADMSDTQLERQTRARLFTQNRNAYLAADSKANGAAWGVQSSNWNDHRGNQRLVNKPDDVRISTKLEGFPGKAAGLVTTVMGNITRISGALTGGEPLPPGGLVTGTITVAVNNVTSMPAPLNALNLKLTESNSLAINDWSASGPAQTAARVKPFAPSTILSQVNFLLEPMKAGLSLLEPAFLKFNPGQICPDVVPNDRVQGNNNLPVYAGAQPCF
ncbi:MAG: hypothetical protein V4631_21895 [Pseudomonadota bacterium]